MQIIQHLTDRLDVAVTDDGTPAIVVYGPAGRVVAPVPDIEELARAMRKADLIGMERRCPYKHSHTRDLCGRPGCREN